MDIKKFAQRGVEVRSEVRRSRVSEKVDGLFKEDVTIDRFNFAAGDETFWLSQKRQFQREKDSRMVRGKYRGDF